MTIEIVFPFFYIHSSYTVLLRCRGFHFSLDLYTIGRIPWASDRPVAKPLHKYRAEQTENKRTYTPNIHALSGIQTHKHSVRASEDSSCLKPLGYRDRPIKLLLTHNNVPENVTYFNQSIQSDYVYRDERPIKLVFVGNVKELQSWQSKKHYVSILLILFG
jgi:hypothetical protein